MHFDKHYGQTFADQCLPYIDTLWSEIIEM